MPLPVSTLSIAGGHVAAFLRGALDAGANNLSVRVGHPAGVPADSEQHQLNLFFYRLEPSAFQSEGHPQEPWRMRLFCLVTPFAVEEAAAADDVITAGENDLRLLGEVLRVLHEQPVLPAVDAAGVTVRLQGMLLPTTDEQLNQVWSTQGDTAYRPSALYEFALFPVVPAERRPGALRVGAFGVQARGMAARFEAFEGAVRGPLFPLTVVDVRDPAWVPVLAWVDGDVAVRTLAIDVDAPGFAGFVPGVWIAGVAGAAVALQWEQWGDDGFVAVGAPIAATAHTESIDPDHPPAALPAFPTPAALPLGIPVGRNAAQFVLYAQRDVPELGGGVRRVRSAPLLITLFRGAA